jgi:hypothetical protein
MMRRRWQLCSPLIRMCECRQLFGWWRMMKRVWSECVWQRVR